MAGGTVPPAPFFAEAGMKEVFTVYSKAVMLGKWKLVHDLLNKREELYNLETDPGEARDLLAGATADPVVLADLRDRLREFLREGVAEPAQSVPLDPETIEQLRSIGYIH